MSVDSGSVFPRIAPDDPLAEAASATNMLAEEHGLEATLELLGMTTGAGELAYLGEQRALRAVAAAGLDLNMGSLGAFDERVARAIVATPLWRDMRMLLVGVFMDGVAIGWKGRELSGPQGKVRAWLVEFAAHLQDESDYFDRDGEADTAAEWAERAAKVRAFIDGGEA